MIGNIIAALASAVYNAWKIYRIRKGDDPIEEKKRKVEACLRSFHERMEKLAAATEPDWDDTILMGIAEWLDEAADWLVANTGGDSPVSST